MKIMADAVAQKMPERLFYPQVLLPAYVAKMALQFGAAIQAIVFMSVMVFHRGSVASFEVRLKITKASKLHLRQCKIIRRKETSAKHLFTQLQKFPRQSSNITMASQGPLSLGDVHPL
jgi:hypothetical protein